MAASFDEARIRLLLDEALNRTPAGGFPEIEKREGLRAGTLFDWIERYAPDGMPPAPYSAMHVWVGVTDLDRAAFDRYFEGSPQYAQLDDDDIEAAPVDVTGCGFSIDLGSRYLHDDDLLHVVWLPRRRPVRELLAATTMTAEASIARIVEECAARGIEEANAAFVYADPAQDIPDPGASFAGLSYIGLFPAHD